MSKAVSLKIKTPNKTYSYQDYTKNITAISKEMERNIASVALRNFSKSAMIAKQQELSIVSTFFQRVCSRTPIDEEYEIGKPYRNKEGVLIERLHEPDNVVCRYDWYIEKNGVRVTAREIQGAYSSVFDIVNDKDSIEEIKTYLKFIFGNDIYANGSYEVGNDNPYFATLEYGGYKKDGDIKKGDKAEHGVDNKHSVQAPVGMLRITQAELMRSSKNIVAQSALAQRFRGRKDYNVAIPSDATLKSLIEILKKGKIRYGDIKRYVDEV